MARASRTSGSLTRGGEENVPNIRCACATHNFTLLASSPCAAVGRDHTLNSQNTHCSPSWKVMSAFWKSYRKKWPCEAGAHLDTWIAMMCHHIHCLFQVKVMFESSRLTVLEDKPALTVESLLGTMGGTLNLWIGISFVTVIELIDMLLTLIMGGISRPKVEDSPGDDKQDSQGITDVGWGGKCLIGLNPTICDISDALLTSHVMKCDFSGLK